MRVILAVISGVFVGICSWDSSPGWLRSISLSAAIWFAIAASHF